MIYGHDKTIHGTTHLDVETKDGEVVSVWFRCMGLPFVQHEVAAERADEMKKMSAEINKNHEIHAVETKRSRAFWTIERQKNCSTTLYVQRAEYLTTLITWNDLDVQFKTREDAESYKTRSGLDDTWSVVEHSILED